MLLLLALCMCWGFQEVKAQTGNVQGVVLADGVPAVGLYVDVSGPSYFDCALTDSNGHYTIGSIPAGVEVTVWLVWCALGYHVVNPANGEITATLGAGQSITVDFHVEPVQAGPARGAGYWKHQLNALVSGRGHAEYSMDEIFQYYDEVRSRFFWLAPWNIESSFIYCYMADSRWFLGGGAADFLDFCDQSCFGNWGPHFMAVLLNITSNRLHWGDVVSDDGATVSQAFQQLYALSGDDDGCWSWSICPFPTTPGALQLLKDIAEAMNENRMIPAGVIDLTRPTIYYTHAMPSAPVVDQVRVTPNPMVKTSTLDFEVATAGRVEVRVFDIAGRAVRTLLDAELPTGHRAVVWDGTNAGGEPVANGVYFYRVETASGGPLIARFAVMQ